MDTTTNDDGQDVFELQRIAGLETFTLQGKTFHIYQAKDTMDAKQAIGYCDPTIRNGERIIWINDQAKGLGAVMACVHEAIHACLPELSEERVTSIGDEIADFVGAYLFLTEPGCREMAGIDPALPPAESLKAFLTKFGWREQHGVERAASPVV